MARIGSQPAGRGKNTMSGTRMAKRRATKRIGGSSSSPIFIALKFDPPGQHDQEHETQIAGADQPSLATGCRPEGVRSHALAPLDHHQPRPGRPSPRRCLWPAGCRDARPWRRACDRARPTPRARACRKETRRGSTSGRRGSGPRRECPAGCPHERRGIRPRDGEGAARRRNARWSSGTASCALSCSARADPVAGRP